tara:strand:- start:29 stop:592 length:564 start_codon:yes stop_codon:yes gene_type:complete
MMILGNPKLINTYNPSSVVEQEITSGLDSTYSSYMFVFTDMHTQTDSKVITFQAWNAAVVTPAYDTPTTTAPCVAYNYEVAPFSNNFDFEAGIKASSQTTMVEMHRRMGNASDNCMAGIFILINPASTTHDKYFYYNFNNTMDLGPATTQTISQGQFQTTSAITKIRFSTNGVTTLFDGTIQLYGVT